jgi:hypothetical protein
MAVPDAPLEDTPGAPADTADAPVDAARADAPVAAADAPGSADGPSFDAAADVPAGDEWTRWNAFFERREALLTARKIACLNIAPALAASLEELPNGSSQVDTRLEIRLGLVAVDDGAAAACLHALETASCEAMAVLVEADDQLLPHLFPTEPFLVCGAVLTGKITTGGACVGDVACRDRATEICMTGNLCGGGHCQRPESVAAGQPCVDGRDECPLGTVCRAHPFPGGPTSCVPAGAPGEPCLYLGDCQAGLYCHRTTVDRSLGTCQPVQLGNPCAGSWECPQRLACVAGACVAGKKPGESCTVQAVDNENTTHSDCAVFSYCIDLDGSGRRCRSTSPLGGPCGVFPDPPGSDAVIECDLGSSCNDLLGPERNQGVCQPNGHAGEECLHRVCVPPAECRGSPFDTLTCMLPPVPQPLGSPCSINDARTCTDDAYCQSDTPGATEGPGTCRPLGQLGDPCSADHVFRRCDVLLTCLAGTCARCP